MNRPLTLILVLLLSSCAASSTRATEGPAPAVSATPFVKEASPVWRRTLPERTQFSSLSVLNGVAVGAGDSGMAAFDVRTGKVIWHNELRQFTPYRDGDTVYADAGDGGVTAISARTGSRRWSSANVCPADAFRPNPTVLYASAADVYAACGSRITRLRKSDGARMTSARPLSVEKYQTIQRAGAGALAVAGFSSGATLNFSQALVHADTLETIGDPRQDTEFLGVADGSAILDDGCCQGRPDVYDPATLVIASLQTGQTLTPVDLRPDPQLFPADKRPVGQGAATALIDMHLYLAVAPMLYDYGNPRTLARTPKRLLDNLTQVPTFMGPFIFAQPRQRDGTVMDEILDLRGGGMHVRWQHPEGVAAMAIYDPASPSVASIEEFYRGWRYTAFVRLADGAEIDVPDGCGRPFASDGRYLAVQCSSPPPTQVSVLRLYSFVR